ncbi:MAG: hypothetical protein AVDCRST_MAG56-6709 [uncultured Cytophagales bacterium]|uniref:Uncharacterized protein n=1 Tax=uncultured Cytophagales bacterium TaxID=158755 RepID=A0A6J4KWY8_9SPHI|nr:MAG: hypothetical protein AVDCRST_MAG56-6709 [uncultured Cytophagales bacterium]
MQGLRPHGGGNDQGRVFRRGGQERVAFPEKEPGVAGGIVFAGTAQRAVGHQGSRVGGLNPSEPGAGGTRAQPFVDHPGHDRFYFGLELGRKVALVVGDRIGGHPAEGGADVGQERFRTGAFHPLPAGNRAFLDQRADVVGAPPLDGQGGIGYVQGAVGGVHLHDRQLAGRMVFGGDADAAAHAFGDELLVDAHDGLGQHFVFAQGGEHGVAQRFDRSSTGPDGTLVFPVKIYQGILGVVVHFAVEFGGQRHRSAGPAVGRSGRIRRGAVRVAPAHHDGLAVHHDHVAVFKLGVFVHHDLLAVDQHGVALVEGNAVERKHEVALLEYFFAFFLLFGIGRLADVFGEHLAVTLGHFRQFGCAQQGEPRGGRPDLPVVHFPVLVHPDVAELHLHVGVEQGHEDGALPGKHAVAARHFGEKQVEFPGPQLHAGAGRGEQDVAGGHGDGIGVAALEFVRRFRLLGRGKGTRRRIGAGHRFTVRLHLVFVGGAGLEVVDGRVGHEGFAGEPLGAFFLFAVTDGEPGLSRLPFPGDFGPLRRLGLGPGGFGGEAFLAERKGEYFAVAVILEQVQPVLFFGPEPHGVPAAGNQGGSRVVVHQRRVFGDRFVDRVGGQDGVVGIAVNRIDLDEAEFVLGGKGGIGGVLVQGQPAEKYVLRKGGFHHLARLRGVEAGRVVEHEPARDRGPVGDGAVAVVVEHFEGNLVDALGEFVRFEVLLLAEALENEVFGGQVRRQFAAAQRLEQAALEGDGRKPGGGRRGDGNAGPFDEHAQPHGVVGPVHFLEQHVQRQFIGARGGVVGQVQRVGGL